MAALPASNEGRLKEDGEESSQGWEVAGGIKWSGLRGGGKVESRDGLGVSAIGIVE